MKIRTGLKLLVILIIPIAGLRIFTTSPHWVERYYSRGLYPRLHDMLNPLFRDWPFSLFELLIYGVILLALILPIRWFVLWRRGRCTCTAALGHVALRYALLLTGIYLWFLVTWGLNYHRVPLTEKMSLNQLKAEDAHFLVTSRWAAMEMGKLFATADEGEVEAATRSALDSLDRELNRLGEAPPEAKLRFKEFLWNYPLDGTRTYGIISPFTLEGHLSASLFPAERPFLAAHEGAHLRGYASETEANFLAFEACLRSDHPLARFSGFLCIFSYLSHAIPRSELTALYEKLPEGVKDLYRAIRKRDQRHAGNLLEGARVAYDLYLKFNAQPQGLRTYSLAGAWVARMHYEEARLALEGEPEDDEDPGNEDG